MMNHSRERKGDDRTSKVPLADEFTTREACAALEESLQAVLQVRLRELQLDFEGYHDRLDQQTKGD